MGTLYRCGNIMIESFTIFGGLLALLSIFREVKHKNIVFWVFTLSLIVFDGLRWQMGTDWFSYSEYFKVAEDVNMYGGFELGFRVYTTLIRNFTDNYSIYLLITTAIIYIGIFYTVFRMTNYSFISLFYLAGTIPWYSGSLRQMMASVFFVLALKATIEKNFIRFVLLMLGGLMFHTTLLVFFPMYFLYGMQLGYLVLVFIFLTVLAVFSRSLIYALDWLASLISYSKDFVSRLGGTLEFSNPLLGFSRKFLTIGGLWGFSFMATTSPRMDWLLWQKIKFVLSLSSLSLIFYYIGTYHIDFVSSRLDIYASILSTSVLIGLLEKSFTNRGNKLLLYLFVVALLSVFYARLEFMDLFHPYSSLFYNYNLNRALY
jgi:EpsG family